MFKITQLRNCGINACTVVEKTFEYRNVFLTTTINHITVPSSLLVLILRLEENES